MKSFDGIASNGGDSWVLGPVTIGVSFEISIPKFELQGRKYGGVGFGTDFGFIADNKGLGWYFTDKEVGTSSSFSFVTDIEASYMHGLNGMNATMFWANGRGYSQALGLGFKKPNSSKKYIPYGFGFSTDKARTYNQYSISIGLGFNYSYSIMNTNTKVYPIFYNKQ